ncbi:MAG TPA: glycoside hydrolase family 2 TIM barrel-domain containing protein [Chloroflexota bacterium]
MDEIALHPNPQMARRAWTDLRGSWGFAYDDENRGLSECWQERADLFDRTITVPFPPESPASGVGDPRFHPIVWYRRTVEVTDKQRTRRLILHFGAVDYLASVWLNGRLVASHEGGMTPFQADISDVLQPGSDQVLVVRAEDLPSDLAQPRGKQDWQLDPHDIWYRRTTGIWQPVWLEEVAPTHIAEIRWTPDIDRGMLGMAVRLSGSDTQQIRLHARLTLHDVPIADDIGAVYAGELQRDLSLDLGDLTMSRERVLWSPSHPNLVDAQLELLDADGEVVDEVSSYAGLRSVGTEGGRFLLNGRPYYLRMALEQGYWPESHLAAPGDDAIRREVELAKRLGFNGVRIHQKVEDPRFLYWCDRLGLLAWGEMANAYIFSRMGVERITREWLDVVARDASHPCIVAWVPINESWGAPNVLHDPAQQHLVQTLYHLTKTLDPTRPVIGNDGWEYVVGDMLGIHDYTFDGETIRARYGSPEAVSRTISAVQPGDRFVRLAGYRQEEVPVALTEFGGIGYRPEGGREWFGYGTVADIEEFRQKYQELLNAVLDCPTLAGFCYTQLTDTGQETNGLLTEWREPKIDPAVIRAINSRPSAAVPSDIVTQLRMNTSTSFSGVEPGAEQHGSESNETAP